MRKFLANVLYIFVGLPLALSALFLASARPWALDRETYKRFVTDDRLYAALQAPELAGRAPATIKLGPASFDGPSLTSAIQRNLPVPELKATGSRAIDAAIGAMESGARGGTVELDLKQLKAALKAKSPAVARDYAAALSVRSGSAAAIPKPAELTLALSAAVDAVPDTASSRSSSTSLLPRIGGPMGVLSRGPSDQGLSQALLNRMTATTAALSALVLAGLGALGGTNLASRLSRGGRYLLLPSIIVLAAGVALAIPGGLILQNVLSRDWQGLAAGAQLRAYLASALGPIARSFFITGLVGASVGGVLSQAKRMAEPKELE